MTKPLHKFSSYFKDTGIFSNLRTFNELESRIENIKINFLHNDKSKRTLEQTKGDVFEVFIEALLNTSNRFNTKKIYPELKAPYKVLDKLNISTMDMGADGIYLDNQNKICTYQAKYRSNNSSLTWEKLSTFIGVSEKAKIRHLFTNTNKIAKEFLRKERILVTDRNFFTKLNKQDFDRINDWLNKERPRIIKAKKDRYQVKARDNFVSEFKSADRASAVMACGSGKTLVGLWTFEKMWENIKLRPKITLILVPSIGLVKQIRADWLEQTKFKNKGDISTIQICSSSDSSNRDDEIQLTQQDLDFEITTNVKKIKKWLNIKSSKPKIIFSTYQSSPTLAKAIGGKKLIDFAIFDEAHRTSRIVKIKNKKDISAFSLALHDENIHIKKRLFMTATRRISSTSKFNKEGDYKLLATMDNELIYGRLVENLTFNDAAKQNIIAKLKIIISYVTSKDIDRYKRSISSTLVKGKEISSDQLANQIAIRNAVKKYNINKIFTFHSSVNRAQSFTSKSNEGIKNHLKSFYTNYVEGKMRNRIREIHMNEFRNYDNAIISNARCLIEGVDVPSVNMVCFIDPKYSHVDIVQAAGRALRNRNQINKKFGYVLIPIFVEKKNNETDAEALKKTSYDQIATIINAVKDYDDELSEIITEVVNSEKRVKGYRNRIIKKLSEKIEGINPIITKGQLLNNIKTTIVDRIKTSWDEKFSELIAYKDKFKDCNVPFKDKNYPELADWVNNIRIRKYKNQLYPFQEKQLEKIGFRWSFDGETLQNVNNLLKTSDFAKLLTISKDALEKNLIKNGKLTPIGFKKSYPFTSKVLDSYFSPNQKDHALKKLNITLNSTKGLYNTEGFSEYTGIHRKKIEELINKKKFKPIGFAPTVSTISSPYFHKNQKKNLLKLIDDDELRLLYITTNNVKDKIRFDKLAKKPLIDYPLLRDIIVNKKIKYYVYFNSGNKGQKTYYFKKKDVKKIYKILGITLFKTKSLISQKELEKKIGNSIINISRAKNKKLNIFKSEGVGIVNNKGKGKNVYKTNFYKKNLIDKYFKLRGITLKNTKNYLSEVELCNKIHISKSLLNSIIKDKIISPKGKNIFNNQLMMFFNQNVTKTIKKYYGTHCNNTKGLLEESKISKMRGLSDMFQINKYRFLNKLKPRCRQFSLNRYDPLLKNKKPKKGRGERTRLYFYHPDDIKKYLKEEKGVTIFDTKNLICVGDLKNKKNIYKKVIKSIHNNKIKIEGMAYSKNTNVSPFISKQNYKIAIQN